jgi:predicted nucleotide-binding protein (sugar kinase/HSP70/actin superfamily)
MYEQFADVFGLSWEENERALDEGYKAQDKFQNEILRGQGREILKKLEAEDRIGIVVLGHFVPQRSRHQSRDPEEFQKIDIRCSRCSR